MKKTLTVLLIMILMLSGCSSKPKGVSDGVYNGGIKALEIIDSYLDFSTSKASAKSKLNEIVDRMDALDPIDDMYDYTIKLHIQKLSSDLSGLSKATSQDILEDRNKLAEDLNKKKR